MRKFIYPILAFIIAIVLLYINQRMDEGIQQENLNQESTQDIVNGEVAIIRKNLLPSSTTGDIIHHHTYSLSYNELHEQSEWVAYVLRDTDVVRNEFKRPFFEQDPYVSTQSAQWWNYKNSGYDKGHLCPAGDRRATQAAYDETFLTSNISPQLHDFNAGPWNSLEQQARKWAKEYETIFVITGGVLRDDLKKICEEGVSVPTHFYKILFRYKNGKPHAIAWLMPQEGTSNYTDFYTSVDTIEAATGIDFFTDFDDEIEARFESQVNQRF